MIGQHMRYSRSSGWPGGGWDGTAYTHWVLGRAGGYEIVTTSAAMVRSLASDVREWFSRDLDERFWPMHEAAMKRGLRRHGSLVAFMTRSFSYDRPQITVVGAAGRAVDSGVISLGVISEAVMDWLLAQDVLHRFKDGLIALRSSTLDEWEAAGRLALS